MIALDTKLFSFSKDRMDAPLGIINPLKHRSNKAPSTNIFAPAETCTRLCTNKSAPKKLFSVKSMAADTSN